MMPATTMTPTSKHHNAHNQNARSTTEKGPTPGIEITGMVLWVYVATPTLLYRFVSSA